jgi:hypothetical protein
MPKKIVITIYDDTITETLTVSSKDKRVYSEDFDAIIDLLNDHKERYKSVFCPDNYTLTIELSTTKESEDA